MGQDNSISISRRGFLEAGGKGLIALGLGGWILQACNYQGPLAMDLQSITLWRAINEFRDWHNLPVIPISQKLTLVAQAHVQDINQYHPEKNCIKSNGAEDGHAWSMYSGSPYGCYEGIKDANGNPVSSSSAVMVDKAKALQGYPGNAYEISCLGTFPADPQHTAADEALHCWTGWVWAYNKPGTDDQGYDIIRRIIVKQYAKQATNYFGYLRNYKNQGSPAHTDVILGKLSGAPRNWKAMGAAVGVSFACAWFGEVAD